MVKLEPRALDLFIFSYAWQSFSSTEKRETKYKIYLIIIIHISFFYWIHWGILMHVDCHLFRHFTFFTCFHFGIVPSQTRANEILIIKKKKNILWFAFALSLDRLFYVSDSESESYKWNQGKITKNLLVQLLTLLYPII